MPKLSISKFPDENIIHTTFVDKRINCYANLKILC